jgi:M6 family metalloprotease-like protein
MSATKRLYKWWDSERLDNYTTTHPSWVGSPGEWRSPNYRFAGMEGLVFDPDSPQPPETDPLFSWWDPDRQDNHTTTHPAWRGSPGETRSPNYRFSRLEGYVFSRPIAGTWPLYRWWSPGHTDNHTTTDWLPDEDGRHSPDYIRGRLEGYVLPPERELSRVPATTVGYRPGFLTSPRPLLVILVEFADARLAHADSFYEALVFGPEEPNLVDYFAEISSHQFLWTRAGVCRVSFAESSDVALADSRWTERLMRQVAAAGFDYARFDRDGDGLVTDKDLGVLRIVSTFTPAVRAGGQTHGLPALRIGGVQLRLQTSNCDENGDIVLFAHELFHQLVDDEHIYGPGAELNYKASLFAANTRATAGDAGPVHLDPWNKLRVGWMRPRVVPITPAGGSASIRAAQDGSPDDDSSAPLVFYDPQRGTDELFIVEYRTPSTPIHPGGGYDATVLGQGVAIWYVQRESDGTTPTFNWPPPVVPVAGGNMFANYLLGPVEPGKGPFWTAENGEFSLPWGDGSESVLRLRVDQGNPASPYALVQWRHRDHPFLPRIDAVRAERTPRESIVTLDGVFGIRRPGARIVLEAPSGRHPVMVNSWSLSRLTVRIGEDIAPGAYMIRVYGDETSSSGGNPLPLVVTS